MITPSFLALLCSASITNPTQTINQPPLSRSRPSFQCHHQHIQNLKTNQDKDKTGQDRAGQGKKGGQAKPKPGKGGKKKSMTIFPFGNIDLKTELQQSSAQDAVRESRKRERMTVHRSKSARTGQRAEPHAVNLEDPPDWLAHTRVRVSADKQKGDPTPCVVEPTGRSWVGRSGSAIAGAALGSKHTNKQTDNPSQRKEKTDISHTLARWLTGKQTPR
jgi:hypothetical protein